MFPILYDSITVGTVPQHNGLGILSDCISCKVEQARNDIYELTMEYPMSGLHAEEISYRRILKVKPNFTDNPQLFRIDRIGKTINGKFTVYAKHISYDLSGYEITSGTASSATDACLLLQNKASGYSITTDKTVSAAFKITEPSSVKSWFVGKEGSFLDVYGGADIKYDNFNVQFLTHAGEDRGVTIRYGKNLLELSQEITDTLYTHVMCYWKNEDTVVSGNKVSTGLTLDVPKCLVVDCSPDYQTAPSVTDLTNKATAYKNSHNLTVPANNIKLDFVQSGELKDRVDLCDTVSVYYEALGITRTQVKCIRTVWDCIKEKYIETEFGDSVQTLADTIAINNKALANKPDTSFMEEAVKHATELITGNLGGYVIMHDSNGDGKPDEILIMNTEDITTATQVWRFNKSGLGYATSYAGTYGLALTSDGQIVADKITSGTLNADIIKAGVISDVNGNSSIDMTSGQATMNLFTAKGNFNIINSSNSKRMGTIFPYAEGGAIQLNDSNQNGRANLFATNDGGYLYLYNSSGTRVVNFNAYGGGSITGNFTANGSGYFANNHIGLFSSTYGGNINVSNSSDDNVIWNFVGSNGQGEVYVGDGSTTNVYLHGGSGNITCVSVTQTSSRKTKKNIEDIDDSEKILLLQAVRFDFINEQRGNDKRGFIAEDVAEILPNLVTEASDDIPASLDYIGMIPYLQDIVKKQEARITELEDKIEKLYNTVNNKGG